MTVVTTLKLVNPKRDEITRRRRIRTVAERFILDRSEMGEPNLTYRYFAESGDAEEINGVARLALTLMFQAYEIAATSDTLTARQSAINLARSKMRKNGFDVVTLDAEPDTPGAAFGLAMAYFHRAIQDGEQRTN